MVTVVAKAQHCPPVVQQSFQVKPGEKKGKVVFGSLKGPSDVTFFEGNAYIVDTQRMILTALLFTVSVRHFEWF